VRTTKPAQTVEEPVRPKRPSSTAEGRVRATPPAEPHADSEAEAPKGGQEPPGKKKRKRKPKPEAASRAWIWWLAGGAGGLLLLGVAAGVVLLVVYAKPGGGGTSKARSGYASEDGWADAKTAAAFAGPDPEHVANMMQIYTMGGEVKFAKDAEHTVVALRLHSPHASDSFMNVIRNYYKLKYLDLSYCRLTDFGLQQFYQMKQLEEFNLKNTQVSNAGILTLHEMLPTTKIDF
jgi:hypothetical protein